MSDRIGSKHSAAYSQIDETIDNHGDEDEVVLLQNRSVSPKPKRRPTYIRMLIAMGAIVLLLLTYLGGLVTEWRLRPLGKWFNREDRKIIGDKPFFSSNMALGNTSSGPVLGDIGNLTMLEGDPGTNFNAPSLLNLSAQSDYDGFFLGAPLDLDALGVSTKNPVTPIPSRAECTFEYKSHLGFDGSMPLGDLRRSDGRIEREDARQGPLGNCGFLAAIIALIGIGRQSDLQRAIIQVGNTLEVRFKYPVEALFFANNSPQFTTRTDLVKIDDKLPATNLSSADRVVKGCDAYLGAYPGTGLPVIPARPVLYVPLLEKAWAKYTDAYPAKLRPQGSKAIGYPGIEGTSAALVMQALTGLQAQTYSRTKEGFDINFAIRILLCIVASRPCVFGTPNATTLAGLGVKKEPGPAIINEAGIIATNQDEDLYDVLEDGTRRVLTFVGEHAYALDFENSDAIDGTVKTFENAEVTIINPWQKNYNFRLESSKEGSIRLKLKTLAFIMETVYWVQEPQ